MRARGPLAAVGIALSGGALAAMLVLIASLVTCSRRCHADPLATYAGLRAAMERLP